METFVQILSFLLPVGYLAAFVLYLRRFLEEDAEGPFFGSPLLVLTLVLHGAYLAAMGAAYDHIPISSRAEFLSLVVLCIGFVYIFAERKHGDPNTGVFFLPLLVVGQTWSSLLMDHGHTHPLLYENQVYGIHVLFTVFGFTSLAVSALYALMYILLARQLKSRNLGLIFRRLPPLNILEKMSRLATLFGILFLGIGLATGHFLAVYVLDDFNLLDPKIVITYIAWAGYALGYLVVKLRGLSGLRIGYLSLGGYLALIAAMIFVNTFLPSFHSFQ